MDTEGPNSMVRYYTNPYFAIYIPQYGEFNQGAAAIVEKLFSRIPISYILSSKATFHNYGISSKYHYDTIRTFYNSPWFACVLQFRCAFPQIEQWCGTRGPRGDFSRALFFLIRSLLTKCFSITPGVLGSGGCTSGCFVSVRAFKPTICHVPSLFSSILTSASIIMLPLMGRHNTDNTINPYKILNHPDRPMHHGHR